MGRDLYVNFRVYNIGKSAAYNVVLQESGYKPDTFNDVVGAHGANWKVIPAGGNVTHTFIVRPNRPTRSNEPFYGYPAAATYTTTAEATEKLTAYSNDIGAFHIYQRGELTKRVKAPASSWAVVIGAVAVSTIVPLTLWRKFQKKKL